MTQTVPFGGKDLRVLLKDSPTDTTPDFVAMITTKEIEWVNEFDDATVPEADAPDQVPSRRSFLKARAWNTSFSGIADAKGFRILQAAAGADMPTSVQVLVAKAAAAGGGHWDGAVWFENLKLSSQDNGVAKFSGQLRGEGPLAWTAAS
ncbi:hypothetical protein LRS73_17910 [Methylobacterium currus]|uniref:hypothetical protein n=1 Tax=Methylobacterium currus TaxID=2051553 RepID=UPI001E657D55|nr:hypothetical protein [Methylobacterium currus]UHC14424.1 hypothetical protein LRS73_17910 [Methylobacterium currus]